MDWRQHILLISFFGLCLGVIWVSENIDDQALLKKSRKSREEDRRDKNQSKSDFKGVDLFVFQRDAPFLKFNSLKLTVDDYRKNKTFVGPSGIVYSNDGTPIHYQAKVGFFSDNDNILDLEKEVIVNTSDTRSESQKMRYFISKDRIMASGDVKTRTISPQNGDQIYVNSQKVLLFPQKKISRYSGNVNGWIKRKKVYEESIEFKSDNLYLDGKKLKIKLTGSVFLKKQEVRAHSHRGEIFLENYNKKLKYYALYDDIRLSEKLIYPEGRIVTRKAFAEKLEGIMSEDKIILTGYPKVFQEKDVIKGNRIVLRENNEIIEVDDANTNIILK